MDLREMDQYIEMEWREGWITARCKGKPGHYANAPGGASNEERFRRAVEKLAEENPDCPFCIEGLSLIVESEWTS